jgi:hypothetical protein
MASAQARAGPIARAETDEEKNLGNIMAKGSIADVMHDFSDLKISKSTIKSELDLRNNLLEGLPNFNDKPGFIQGSNYDEFLLTEPKFLQSIMEMINDNPIRDDFDFNFVANTAFSLDNPIAGFVFEQKKEIPIYYTHLQTLVDKKFESINEAFPKQGQLEPSKKEFKLTTTTGHEYTVTQAVIKNKTIKKGLYGYNDPQPLLEELGIKDNSAFVVDFAAISLPEFLTQKPNVPSSRPTPVDPTRNPIKLYFITNPATENDAAGKTSATTPVYKNVLGDEAYREQFKNGVEIYSLVQGVTDNKVTNYNWLLNGGDSPTNEFFTAYNFALSDLIEVKDGKNIKFKTDLTISDPRDIALKPQYIPDSGNFGKISSVVSNIFKKIKNIFKKAGGEDNFFLNSKLQHKRSGDWLQLLSCMTAKNMTYKYPKCKRNNFEYETPANLNISDVYFVTHDVVPFAIALSLGINVVFTHSDTSAYYVFKIGPPDTPEQREAKILEKIQNAVEKLTEEHVIPDITGYNAQRLQFLREYRDEINQLLNDISIIVQVDVNTGIPLTNALKGLFIKLNEYALFISRYKKINDSDAEGLLDVLNTKKTEFAGDRDNINKANSFLQQLSLLKTEINNIDKILLFPPEKIDFSLESKEFKSTISLIKKLELKTGLIQLKRGEIKEKMTTDEIEPLLRNKLLTDIVIWDKNLDNLPNDIKVSIVDTFENFYKKFFNGYFTGLLTPEIDKNPDITSELLNKFKLRLTKNLAEDYNKWFVIMKKFIDEIRIKFAIKQTFYDVDDSDMEVAPVAVEEPAVVPAVAGPVSAMEEEPESASLATSVGAIDVEAPIEAMDLPLENVVLPEIKLFDNEIINDYIDKNHFTMSGGIKRKYNGPEALELPESPESPELPKSTGVGGPLTPLTARRATGTARITRSLSQTTPGFGTPGFGTRPPSFGIPSSLLTPISATAPVFPQSMTIPDTSISAAKRVKLSTKIDEYMETYTSINNLTDRTYSLLNHVLTKSDYNILQYGIGKKKQKLSLQNHSDCFHPLLPIFMLTEALHKSFIDIKNDYINETINIKDSDKSRLSDINNKYRDIYDNYFNYFIFMKEFMEIMIKQTHPNNVRNMYIIGLGLRSLLFTSPECWIEVFNELFENEETDKELSFKQFIIFTSQLRTHISGDIIMDTEGESYYLSSIFIEFLRIIFIKYIKKKNIDNLIDIEPDIKKLLVYISENINFDRTAKIKVSRSRTRSITSKSRERQRRLFEMRREEKKLGTIYEEEEEESESELGGGKQKYTKKHNTKVFKKTRRHNKRLSANKSKKKSHRLHKKKYTIRYY